MQERPFYTRRLSSRIETPEHVYVLWNCHGRDDVSRVRDIGMGGLFLETHKTKAVGVTASLHFLVDEGQIRADAVVRHAEKGEGLGLKFTAVSDEDRGNLAALMNRMRAYAHAARLRDEQKFQNELH